MLIIITTMSLASATRHACDEDAARALKRPWAPVVFHGERETESSIRRRSGERALVGSSRRKTRKMSTSIK